MDHNQARTLQNLSLLNWNANGIKADRSLFVAFLARYKIDIACITETHLALGEQFKIPGYNVYRKDRPSLTAAGGVAIIAKKSLNHHERILQQFQSIEAVSIRLKLHNNFDLDIVSLYKQPNKQLAEADICDLFKNTVPTLVLGDPNSKNTQWGCRTNNASGKLLARYAASYSLRILSPNEYTYVPYRPDHQPDILDIGISKNFNFPVQQNVIQEMNSDHLPVIINFATIVTIRPQLPKLIEGYVDWEKFRENMNKKQRLGTATSENEINDLIQQFTQMVTQSVKAATIPTKRKRYNPYIPPNHILQLIRRKSQLRRQWQNNRDPITKNLLNNITHRIKREIEAHRIETYQRHISDLSNQDPGLWKTTKRILNQQDTIPSIVNGDIVAESDEEKSEIFATHLQKIFTPSLANIPAHHLQHITSYIESNMPIPNDLADPTTPTEIATVIKTLPVKKAPGHDLIPNVLLKNLPRRSLFFLANIFNTCLRKGYFPKSWKHANVLLFSKPGKDKKLLSSYRPISLLSMLSKLFEKVINNRLRQQLTDREVLPPIQFGFREGYSAVQQLQRISEMIERGYENKEFTTVIFLDIAQAFDRVWLEGLKYKLLKLKLPQYLTATLFSFLQDRTFAVRINSSLSITKPILAGVPQGSILGPTLFNIFTYDFPHARMQEVAMFADDTAIITRNCNLNISALQLQSSLDIAHRWYQQWGITINTNKCEAKIFALRKITDTPSLKIGEQTINWKPASEPVKYLGVYLDTRLTWSYHINKKLNQGHARLNQLYPLINRKSSLNIKCALLLYRSLIRPLITYSCPVWSTTSNTNYRKLQALQNRTLRIALNAPWFVRNKQIHDELAVSTIRDFIMTTTRKHLQKLNHWDGNQTYQLGQRNIHTRLRRKLPQDLIEDNNHPEEANQDTGDSE